MREEMQPSPSKQRRQRLEAVRAEGKRGGLVPVDRHFEKMLFCGAGDHTRREIQLLQDRIEEALDHLSGRQQSPHWMEEPSQEMLDREEALTREADMVCEQVVRDVAAALTGREITFGERSE